MTAYERFGAGRIRTPNETATARKRVGGFWHRCEPTPGTPAAAYLAGRGLPWLNGHPYLRFRWDTPHPSGIRLPALVALVLDGGGNVVAIQRTFLDPTGRKAMVDPVKASMGSFAGGAIRLRPAAPEMVVGEGLETTASAVVLLGLPGWAAIACGNLARNMALPAEVRRVVIAADADLPGRRAAAAAARRWMAEGRDVRIATPNKSGLDFNDIQTARLDHSAMEIPHG